MRLACSVMALASMQLMLARAAADEAGAAPAREHFAAGHKLFGEGRFDDASHEFKRAYDSDPVPKYLYDAAQSARLAGNCAEAIGMYQAFVKVAPDADARLAAEENVVRCRALLPPAAAPSPSAPASSPSSPPSSAAQPAAPPATVSAAPDARDAIRRRHREMKWIAAGGISLTGAALLTAAILEGTAAAKFDELHRTCAPNCTRAQLGPLPREIDAATGLFITAGVAAAATGVTLAVLHWSHR